MNQTNIPSDLSILSINDLIKLAKENNLKTNLSREVIIENLTKIKNGTIVDIDYIEYKKDVYSITIEREKRRIIIFILLILFMIILIIILAI